MSALRFLLLEASLSHAEVVQAALEEGGIYCELLQVETARDFTKALETVPEDLAKSWQERALMFAQEASVLPDVSNCHPLPLNRNENIYPGLRGL